VGGRLGWFSCAGNLPSPPLITQGFAVVLTAEIRHWKAIDSAASSPELPTLTGEGEEREEKREKKRGEREREREAHRVKAFIHVEDSLSKPLSACLPTD
jgi:hypothetical protein